MFLACGGQIGERCCSRNANIKSKQRGIGQPCPNLFFEDAVGVHLLDASSVSLSRSHLGERNPISRRIAPVRRGLVHPLISFSIHVVYHLIASFHVLFVLLKTFLEYRQQNEGMLRTNATANAAFVPPTQSPLTPQNTPRRS